MSIPEFFLKLIYNTTEGLVYIKIIAPFLILHYIQAPLTSCMQAMGYAKEAMFGTLIGAFIKTSLLFILSMLGIGIWGLVIATLANIIFITAHHFYYVKSKI